MSSAVHSEYAGVTDWWVEHEAVIKEAGLHLARDSWPHSVSWPVEPVVYVWDHKGMPLYVGRTSQPKTRVEHHLAVAPWMTSRAQVTLLSLFQMRQLLHVEDLSLQGAEAVLVELISPPYNKRRARV